MLQYTIDVVDLKKATTVDKIGYCLLYLEISYRGIWYSNAKVEQWLVPFPEPRVFYPFATDWEDGQEIDKDIEERYKTYKLRDCSQRVKSSATKYCIILVSYILKSLYLNIIINDSDNDGDVL